MVPAPTFGERGAFLDWARWHPGYQRIDGQTIPPSPTPPSHDATRLRMVSVLTGHLAAQGEPAEVFAGPSLRIATMDDVLVPDITVVPEGRAGTDGMARDPILVAEIISFHTQGDDLTVKLAGYRTIPSLRHIIVLDAERGRCMVARREGDDFRFEFLTKGPLALDAFELHIDLSEFCDLPDLSRGYDHEEAQAEYERAKAAGNIEGYTDLPLPDRHLPRFGHVDDFMAWYDVIPGKQRFELIDGQTYFARPHQAKDFEPIDGFPYGTASQLGPAVTFALGKPEQGRWRSYLGGLLTRIDERTTLSPDVSVVSKGSETGDERFIDPVLVVETLMPETAFADATVKLAAYARKPGISHILLLDPIERTILHARNRGGSLTPAVHRNGKISLDTLGIDLQVEDIFRED